MFLTRQGFPEESDLVMCTVINIQHNSIFVNIHEYGKQGMIPISEIAPGRIRNIRDYVSEGRVVVCKVLQVNKERGYIDLSLRRVSEGQRREKNDALKQEIKAEKIIELAAKSIGMNVEELYKRCAEKFLPTYFYMYQAFDDILSDTISLKDFIDPAVAAVLEKTIREKSKPKIITIAGDVSISLWEENGVEIIRNTLVEAKTSEHLKINYMGGGRYRLLVQGIEYKVVEKILKESSDHIIHSIKKAKGKVEYERVKNLAETTAE